MQIPRERWNDYSLELSQAQAFKHSKYIRSRHTVLKLIPSLSEISHTSTENSIALTQLLEFPHAGVPHHPPDIQKRKDAFRFHILRLPCLLSAATQNILCRGWA